MTSNQIAHEANVIQQQANEWLKEHNSEVRQETVRHNQEMERLQENQTNAVEHGNRIQEAWNKWQQQWQQDYQAKWREYELAQEDEKIAIQEDLRWLEDRKVTAEESYKSAQEANLVYMQGIARDQLELDQSFKEWQKTFSQKQFELNEFQAQVKNKEVEYQYAAQHEQNVNTRNWQIAQNTYNYALLNWEREKQSRSLQNALTLGYLQYNINQANVDIANQNLEIYKKRAAFENFQSLSSGLFGKSGIIPGTVESFTSFIPVIGGISNGKITKSVAEAILFK